MNTEPEQVNMESTQMTSVSTPVKVQPKVTPESYVTPEPVDNTDPEKTPVGRAYVNRDAIGPPPVSKGRSSKRPHIHQTYTFPIMEGFN